MTFVGPKGLRRRDVNVAISGSGGVKKVEKNVKNSLFLPSRRRKSGSLAEGKKAKNSVFDPNYDRSHMDRIFENRQNRPKVGTRLGGQN